MSDEGNGGGGNMKGVWGCEVVASNMNQSKNNPDAETRQGRTSPRNSRLPCLELLLFCLVHRVRLVSWITE